MATAGYTTQGANTRNIANGSNQNNVGLLITLPTRGVVTSVSFYGKYTTTVKTALVFIYSGSAGSRGSQLFASSSSNLASTSYTLENRTLAPTLSAGTYWLEVNIDSAGPGTGTGDLAYDTGGASNTSYILNDLGVPSYSTDQYSVFITYTPVVGVVGNGSFLLTS